MLSRSPFWLYAAGTRPSLRTTKEVYEVGEPIRVRWRAAPGYRWDWMGVFSPGRGPAQNAEDCNAGVVRERPLPAVPLHGDLDPGFHPHRAGVVRGLPDLASEGRDVRDPAPHGRRLSAPRDLQLLQGRARLRIARPGPSGSVTHGGPTLGCAPGDVGRVTVVAETCLPSSSSCWWSSSWSPSSTCGGSVLTPLAGAARRPASCDAVPSGGRSCPSSRWWRPSAAWSSPSRVSGSTSRRRPPRSSS